MVLLIIVVSFSTYNSISGAREFVHVSDLTLANVEALAQNDEIVDRKYETRNETEVEIWDDDSGTFKKLIVIDCEGKGSMDC